jgi:anti-sigma B factor antagonist
VVDPLLSIAVTSSNGTRVVAVAGDLDIATVPELACELGKLEQCNVTVDLTRVTFVDSSGLRCILEARNRIDGDGYTMVVRGASRIVRRAFEITGLDTVLLVADSQG